MMQFFHTPSDATHRIKSAKQNINKLALIITYDNDFFSDL